MSRPAAVRSRGGRLVPRSAPYLFMAPGLTLFVLLLLLPIGYTLYLSLVRRKVSGLGLTPGAATTEFVGLQNYTDAVTDPELVRSVGRVLVYGGLLIPTMLGLALLFALLLDHPRVRFAGFSRLAIFMPYAVPGVLATLLWGFMYLPEVSPFQYVVDELGGPQLNLLSPTSVYGALTNIGVWGGTGFNMIVIFTALRAVPREVIEAARVDGCSDFQLAWQIKIPIVMPAIILTAVFSIIATLQVFAEPQTLLPFTSAIFSTWAPMMKVYADAFIRNDIYAAAATSIVLAFGIFVASFGFLRLVQRRAFAENR